MRGNKSSCSYPGRRPENTKGNRPTGRDNMFAMRRPGAVAAITGSVGSLSLLLKERVALCATGTQTHADAAGLTGAGSLWADFDADGAPLAPPPGRDDDTVSKLGKPPYVKCCPTGTIEFATDLAECDNAVEATVKSLVSRMSTHPPKFLILYGSLRESSYSRKVAVEAGRILASFGADVRVFDPTGVCHKVRAHCPEPSTPHARHELASALFLCDRVPPGL